MTTPRYQIIRRLCKARRLRLHYWRLACDHDGIDSTTLFAVFSASNPWTDRSGRAAMIQGRAVLALRRTL